MSSALRLVFNLFKLRIGVVIALTAVAGYAVQPGTGPDAWRLAVLFLAVLVSSAAAGAFNQYWEHDLDRTMRRTRSRPFATGTLVRTPLWVVLIAALAAGATAAAWATTNGWAAVYTLGGAVVYAIVYTVWLKRRTWWNIVVGGLAGSFAVLAGAASISADAAVAPLPLAFAWILFLWTPPHFWSLAIAFQDDYRAAGVPMLPVVKGDAYAARAILAHAVVLVALSLGLAAFRPGWIYLGCAVVGGWLFVREALRLVGAPSRPAAMRCFHASLAQLSLLLVGALIDAAVL